MNSHPASSVRLTEIPSSTRQGLQRRGEALPLGYETTSLWRSSLAETTDDPYTVQRSRLRNAYYNFRQRAAILAAEIPHDLREYTVHDATHLDALWDLADLIAGEDCVLSPTEAFVLGGSFLIHDLGMGLAAWPGGLAELMDGPGWTDILASCIMQIYGTDYHPDMLKCPPAVAVEMAKQTALRERHAEHAAELALVSWEPPGTTEIYHLIEDSDLRNNYGHLIGKIAASHWCSVDQLPAQFPHEIGAPIDCASEWTVDPLKLACLLRLADAAHIDARRAPPFLRALRVPSPAADLHWNFQGHIQRPQIDGDRLVYTAARPFAESEASAWWLCFDTLQMIDRELHAVDSLLADKSRRQMVARSVKGADSPYRLSSLVPTEGWSPVDARVIVSDVPALARKLGGENLYGHRPAAALRELIQNARDAVCALSSISSLPIMPIRVELKSEQDSWTLTVADCGIGMSRSVLTGPLLDFGKTYWGSQLMRHESPGLASSNFRPAGMFGIGFYAVFMLGDDVKVISRRYDAAAADTCVLEFASGLDQRPILRSAQRHECLPMGGTIISVKLFSAPLADFDSLLYEAVVRPKSALQSVCGWLAPALPVGLVTTHDGQEQRSCISAHDWISIPAEGLLKRLGRPLRSNNSSSISINSAAQALRTIERDGRIIARASLSPPSSHQLTIPGEGRITARGSLVSGGLEIAELQNVIGIFEGAPTKADRSVGTITATVAELSRWASEQAAIWKQTLNRHDFLWEDCVEFLTFLGADMEGIHICCARDGYMTTGDLRLWAADRSEIFIVSPVWFDIVTDENGQLTFWHHEVHQVVDIGDNVIVATDGTVDEMSVWRDPFPDSQWEPEDDRDSDDDIMTPREWMYWNQLSANNLMFTAIAGGWQLDVDGLLSAMTLRPEPRTAIDALGGNCSALVQVLWSVRRGFNA